MKRTILLTLAILSLASIACAQTRRAITAKAVAATKADTSTIAISKIPSKAGIANPAIDMQGYLAVAAKAARYRESRRLTEDEFIRMSREPGTIVLDARSAEKYQVLHIKGAMNLSFPDITVDSLSSTLPDKNARILMYCNNNFVGEQKAFPTKMATASLNISTYIALYNYGYRNVFELGPLLDVKTSRIEFEGTQK